MDGRLEVVIAGGGVAGLEAAFALKTLAEGRVSVTVVSDDAQFVYRPLAVREPFTTEEPVCHPLERVVADAGAEHLCDAFRWLDPSACMLHTRGGRALPYDFVLLALGARLRSAFRHAVRVDFRRLQAQLTGLLDEAARGELRRLAAVVPARQGWPLPLYELCLRLARGARERDAAIEITLLTAESAPLSWFGPEASAAVAELLEASGVQLRTGVSCEVPAPDRVSLRPGTEELEVDRVISLPLLFGPSTPGVPKRARDGFMAIGSHCEVRGLERVYAAGDATDFPVKFGAVAGQQADTAAAAIAAAAGAAVQPAPFAPVIHGVLRGGSWPLYMSAHLIGSHTHRSEVLREPSWGLATRLAARHLAEYLDAASAPTS